MENNEGKINSTSEENVDLSANANSPEESADVNVSAEAESKEESIEGSDPSEPAKDGSNANGNPKKKKGFFSSMMGDKGSSTSGTEDAKIREEMEALQAKLAESQDKYIRLFSEFDNYKKRTSRERVELIKTAASDVVSELLPVVDDFERALASFPADQEPDAIRLGVELVYTKLKGILEKQGLKEIEAMGAPFDTDYHEALTNIPSPDESMKGKVLDVIQKGYMLNDKVIRFARVVVGN
jgi:molecular chaperone GrpE